MSSTQQLWAPTPQRPQLSPAEKLNRADMLPGTWLQLSPVASVAASPSLHAMPAGDVKEELALRPADTKFLSNNIISRSSSMSSDASAPLARHPPLAPKFHASPSVERREMAVARAGGLGVIFGGN